MSKLTFKRQRFVDEYIISGKSTYGEVYLIKNKVNGKSYVGITTRDVSQRFSEHCKANSLIGRAIRKYGEDQFSLMTIDYAKTKEELYQKETDWIKRYSSFGKAGYNLTSGGEGVKSIKLIDVALSPKQKKFCDFVEKDNRESINVNDPAAMIRMVIINVVYLYLIAGNEKDKKMMAKTIAKLKGCYLKEVIKLKVIDIEEFGRYAHQK